MGYSTTTGVIIYWNLDQPFVFHRFHHVWSDEYNYRLSIENNHTPGFFLLRYYPETPIPNSDLLNFIPCELDLTYTTFSYSTILTY